MIIHCKKTLGQNPSEFWLKILSGSGLLVILGFFMFFNNRSAKGALEDQIETKQREIQKVEKQIDDYKVKVSQKQNEMKTLNSTIETLDQNINATAAQVKKAEAEIEKLESDIENKSKEIEILEESVRAGKNKLKNFLVLANEYDRYSLFEIMLKENNLSDFLNQMRELENIESEITETIKGVKTEKEELEKEKTAIEDQREEYSKLQEMKEGELNSLKNDKSIKAILLNKTLGQEKKYQELLAKNQEILPQLREQLMKLQSLGIPINYQDAKNAASIAAQVTGVRPAFIMGVLKIESDLGNNIGGGNYRVDMASYQRETFKNITKELGLDPELMPVSRKPRSYSGWGGAMGPAQMMPITWMGYKSQIAALSGHNPPNPWDLGDAMIGMALKLSNVSGVIGGSRDAEYKAAAMYFAGGNWQKFTWYADRVMFYADLYEQYDQSL